MTQRRLSFTFGNNMKSGKKTIITVSITSLLVLVLILIFTRFYREDDHTQYQGTFDPNLNRVVVDFFHEVSEGSGSVDVAGYPGGMPVYPGGQAIMFQVYSHRTKLPGSYLIAHMPRNIEEGVIEEGVVPLCFTIAPAGNPFVNQTTYRLGDNGEFDQAFVGFMDVYGKNKSEWSDWGPAYKTLSIIKDSLQSKK